MITRPLLAIAILLAVACPILASARHAPSLLPGMPREVVSIRCDRLTAAEYDALAAEWREYAEAHPRSGVAQVELGRTLRYAGAPADEVRAHFARALELDPRCPEALDAAASTFLGEWEPLADGAAGCYALGQRAVELAPDWAEPHFTLAPLAMVLGLYEEDQAHMAALIAKGGIPAPVLDYCYNMLVGAAPDAIIFTNGDNDTYGCHALQAARGLRPDVHVLNLSLLNQPGIETTLFARFGDRSPLSADERARLRDEFMANYVHDHKLYSTRVVEALAGKLAAGEWKGPVYLALTVAPSVVESCPLPRRLEGMLWRLVAEDGEAGDAGTDVVRTHELFTGPYRLDSATDLAFPWARNRSVGSLMDNYHSVLFRLATAASEAGDVPVMRYAFRNGLTVAAFHGKQDMVAAVAEYWRELDPDNPEIDRWR